MRQIFLSILSIFIRSTSYASERSITFKSGDLTLNGSLVLPDAKKNSGNSCVLLLPGSGPTDRDGNQPGLQSDFLKQIAEYLSSKGVVSLRFDKRAVKSYKMFWPADPEKLSEFFSWENFKKDIHAAFAYLKKSPEVDANACSILGHSEGGVFAIDVAAELKPATLILMGTPGRPLKEVLNDQISALLDQQKATADQKKYFLSELSRAMTEVEKNGTIPKDVPPGLQALFPLGAGKFLQTDLSFDPSKKIRSFGGPILILNGLEDKQVNPKLDAEVLYKEAKKRHDVATKIKLFEGLGHELTVAGSSEKVSQVVLETLGDWFKANKIVASKDPK